MATSKVSPGFNNFMAKNQKAVEAAKEAENTMATCIMPVGWEGQCVCVDAVADQSKDKKREDGTIQAGNPYIRLEFQVVGDESYTGKKFSKLWMFNDTAKATAADRFEWCLNEMENLGLPQELRKTFDSIDELLNHFITADVVYECRVVKNDYTRDNKEVKISRSAEDINDTDSVMPTVEETTTKQTEVSYLGKVWDVVSQDGDKFVIRSRTTKQEREVNKSDLD